MTLEDLRKAVASTIVKVYEAGKTPEQVEVSVQVDIMSALGSCEASFHATTCEVLYDNDADVSGCLVLGIL